MKKTINKGIAYIKMNVLRFALKLCGMDSSFYSHEDDFFTLCFDTWNCADGSDVTVSIGANVWRDDYKTFEFVAEPEGLELDEAIALAMKA